jgi:hypothetical protein
MERVDILESRKAVEDERELLRESLLRKLDFSGIEICKSQFGNLLRMVCAILLILLIWKPARI